MRYIRHHPLSGVMFWELSQDSANVELFRILSGREQYSTKYSFCKHSNRILADRSLAGMPGPKITEFWNISTDCSPSIKINLAAEHRIVIPGALIRSCSWQLSDAALRSSLLS